MNKLMVAVLVLSSTALLSGCAGQPANSDVSYDPYEPGYTGYTVGYGAYSIPNGYGPAFWNPGYYNYTRYETRSSRGYSAAEYYNGYHGGYAGHAGYVARGGHGR